MQSYSVELFEASQCHLGEGPVWDRATGILSWVDILRGVLYLFDGTSTRQVDLGQYVGAALPTEQGDYVVALTTGLYRAATDGITKRLPSPQIPLRSRFNDCKCDSQGRLWAGTMDLYDNSGNQGVLYRVEGEDSRAVLTGVALSNGMDWSPDDKTFYYIETRTGMVSAFDFDAGSGCIQNKRTLVEAKGCMPDGMTVDAQGALWVAHWGGGKVCRYDPVSGKLLGNVAVPASRVTSCCFGGARLDTLYITTARQEGEALSGNVFACVPGVTGKPSHRCKCQ